MYALHRYVGRSIEKAHCRHRAKDGAALGLERRWVDLWVGKDRGKGYVCRGCMGRVCIWGHSRELPLHFKERKEGLHHRETEGGLVLSWVRGNGEVLVLGEHEIYLSIGKGPHADQL